MQIIKSALWGYLAFLSGVWWLTDQTNLLQLSGFFEWRGMLMQYTGVIGIGVMSLAMVLAVRPTFLERHLGGLDKTYRLHKWLGISGLVISIFHWLLAKGPKWLSDLGWMERHGRHPHPVFPAGSIQQFFSDQHGLAGEVGEWAFYAAALLMLVALIKYFPYRRFFQTHQFLALAYLALVFHSVILTRFAYWRSPLGAVLIVLMALGSVAALMSLAHKRAGGLRATGKVSSIERQTALRTLAVDVQLQSKWPGHEPGQFAFVTFHKNEGAHPFTIASPWNGDGHVRFMIKALGDYTQTLPQRLKIGDAVKLEGPYGQFNFQSSAPRQIWISGGIGITPFMARMKALAKAHDGKQIDLFHSTTAYDQSAIDKLAEDAAQANVRLHVLWDERDGRLDLGRIINTVPHWREADLWFCGPAGFGRILRNGLASMGFPAKRFHQELFEMR